MQNTGVVKKSTRHQVFANEDVRLEHPVDIEIPADALEANSPSSSSSTFSMPQLLALIKGTVLGHQTNCFLRPQEEVKFVFSIDGNLLPTIQMVRFERRLIVSDKNFFQPRDNGGKHSVVAAATATQSGGQPAAAPPGLAIHEIDHPLLFNSTPVEDAVASPKTEDVGPEFVLVVHGGGLVQGRKPFERRSDAELMALIQRSAQRRLATSAHLPQQQQQNRPRNFPVNANPVGATTTFVHSSYIAPMLAAAVPGRGPQRRIPAPEAEYFAAPLPLPRDVDVTAGNYHRSASGATANFATSHNGSVFPWSRSPSPYAPQQAPQLAPYSAAAAQPAGGPFIPSQWDGSATAPPAKEDEVEAVPRQQQQVPAVCSFLETESLQSRAQSIGQLIVDAFDVGSASNMYFEGELADAVGYVATYRVLIQGPPRGGKTTALNIISRLKAIQHNFVDGEGESLIVVYSWSKILLRSVHVTLDSLLLYCEVLSCIMDSVCAQRSTIQKHRGLVLGFFKKLATQRVYSSCLTPTMLNVLGNDVAQIWDAFGRKLHLCLLNISSLPPGSAATTNSGMSTYSVYLQMLLVDLPQLFRDSLGFRRLLYLFDDADALMHVAVGISAAPGQQQRTTAPPSPAYTTWLNHLLSSDESVHFIGTLGAAKLSPPTSKMKYAPVTVVNLLHLIPVGVLVEKYRLPARICCSNGVLQQPNPSSSSATTSSSEIVVRGNNNDDDEVGHYVIGSDSGVRKEEADSQQRRIFDIGIFMGCPGFLVHLCHLIEELRQSSWAPMDRSFSDTTLTIEDPRVLQLFQDLSNALLAAQ